MLNIGRSASSKNSKTIEKKTIKVPSEIKNLNKVSNEVLDILKSFNTDDQVLFDIRLCVEEAVRNAMVHGNRCNKNLPVKISYWVEGQTVKIEVCDKGNGFDHKKLPDPTDDKYIMRNSGRGVYLIRHLMDEARYNEPGNCLIMSKRLSR